MTPHSRQPSYASSFVSTSANSHHTSGVFSKKRAPVKIGPWKLGKTLGKGATGRVFLATNVENNQKAAVKIVSKAALTNDQSQDNEEQDCDSAGLSYGIEREIIIMKLLNHKNVLRLYDVWETEKALYLVLEYVEGGELFDLLVDSGPLPEKTAVEFFRQIILGAAYCHSLGICHRDLKPENILLDKDLNVKIADFGMAALESGRLLETSCGSPHYAAPEIVSGLHYHGAESDVWSCGVILFALLTGRLPFDDDNIRDLLLKVQVGKYEIVEDLSPEAVDLIHQMLTVDPEARIKTRDILKHPFVKKYYDCEKDDAFIQLPSPESAVSPVKSRQQIDKRILENLVILWHGRSSESIIEALLSPTPNSEKTFYTLLLRYRHDHANSNRNSNGNDLVRSSSVISKATDPISASTSSSSSSNGSHGSHGNKRRSFMMTASTPNKRPISFQKNNRTSRSRDSLQTTEFSAANITASSTASNQRSLLRNKENVQTDETPVKPFNDEKLNRRQSLIATDHTPTKRVSRVPSEASSLKKMLATGNPKSRMKRNSVTSKVLSTYAVMAEYEKNKKSADTYGKRASSDFAALCDVLFGDESKVNTKIADTDSMATINAIVFGGSKRNSARLSIGSTNNKNASKYETKNKKKVSPKRSSTNNSSSKARNASNPIERISKLLNASDLGEFERRTASDIHTHGNTLAAPPRPLSRLDPRFKAFETYQKRTSQHAAQLLQLQEEAEAEAKALAEIKKREEKLKKEQEELERLKKTSIKLKGSDLVNKTFGDDLGLSSGTVLKKNEVDDHFTFQQPKNSKLKSSRYSALSMYSTKASSKRLSFYLRELDDEITKSHEQKKKERISRLSLLVSDPEFTVPDIDTNFDVNRLDNSMNTLNEADEESSQTAMKNQDVGAKPRAASVSDALDNDLCFVDGHADTSYAPVTAPTIKPSTASLKSTPNQSTDINNGADATLASSVYESIPPLPQKVDDTFTSDPENINQKGPKLPDIPGSPIKEKAGNADKTFEIFDDAVRKSKQEFDEKELKAAMSGPPLTSETNKPTENSHISESKPEPIHVEKQRQPLGLKDANQKNRENATYDNRQKGFFLSKLTQLQPSTERKSSFGKTFKSLFSGNQPAPPQSMYTILAADDAFDAMKSLLVGWKHYGVGNLFIDSKNRMLRGELAKNNNLNIKHCRFLCVITPSNGDGSKLTFTQEKGSSKSFEKLVGEVKRILANENVLAH